MHLAQRLPCGSVRNVIECLLDVSQLIKTEKYFEFPSCCASYSACKVALCSRLLLASDFSSDSSDSSQVTI